MGGKPSSPPRGGNPSSKLNCWLCAMESFGGLVLTFSSAAIAATGFSVYLDLSEEGEACCSP